MEDNTNLQELNIETFKDEYGKDYTHQKVFESIIFFNENAKVFARKALGSGSGEWWNCVTQMGKWYEENIHNYGAVYSMCPLVNKKVRHDCTGFVRACLLLNGIDIAEFNSITMTPGSDFDKTLQANGFTLIQTSPYVISETAKPGDICSRTVKAGFGHGHAEIYAGFIDGKHKSWGWGSVHDGKNGHPGMPAGINSKERYQYIWRK